MADGAQGGGGQNMGPTQGNLNDAQTLKETFQEMRNTLTDISSLFRESLQREMEDLDRSSQKILDKLGRDLQKELQRSVQTTSKLEAASSDVTKKLNSVAKVESEILATKSRQLTIDNLIADIELTRGYLTDKEKDYQIDITEQLNKQLKLLDAQLTKIRSIENVAKRFRGVLEGLNKVPFLGQLINTSKILKKMNEEAEKGASKWKVIGTGIMETFASIGSGLVFGSIFKVLSFIVKSVMEVNKMGFELAKTLGVSASMGAKLNAQFIAIANSSKNAGLQAKELSKSYAEITESFGFLAPSNREFSETAALIQKRIGASAEDMATLATTAALSGKNLLEAYGTIEASRQVEGARNKLALTNRQIIEGISKASAVVVLNLKGSVKALSDAVIRATKLGTTLDTVNKQGESLLDFETSIEKEFEAQVLTGRDINMTRSRELALMGDTVGLMEELAKQQVTYDTFMGETVIARRAEAELIGLGADELAGMLLKQKQAQLLGAQEGQSLTDRYNQLVKSGKTQSEIIKMLGSEQAAADLEKASRADQFDKIMERLKTTLGTMLEGPVGGLIDKFNQFVNDGKKMEYIGQTLKKIFDGISNTIEKFPSILKGAVEILKVIVSLSIASAVASIARSVAFTPVVGGALAVVAGAAAYSWLSGLTNGLVSGASAPPSLTGEQTMAAPINQPAAAASSASGAAASTETKPPVFNFNVMAQIGTENISRLTRSSISEDPGTTMV